MPQRRSYQKVRGGCMTCKARKVRCGLERPICENCNKLSRLCAYPLSWNESKRSPLGRESCQSGSITELELMHHYTAYTYSTITENPVLTQLWKEVVPKHAFRHRFLL